MPPVIVVRLVSSARLAGEKRYLKPVRCHDKKIDRHKHLPKLVRVAMRFKGICFWTSFVR